MARIIGFSGKIGTGKDYCANILRKFLPDHSQVTFIAFADHFKVNCMSFKNMRFEDIYLEKTAESRKALQKAGTEEGRHVYGDDIWVNVVNSWKQVYELRQQCDYLFITDVRFENEYKWIKDNNGVVIRIVSPLRHQNIVRKEAERRHSIQQFNSNNPTQTVEEFEEEIKTHLSEVSLDDSEFDYVISNDHENHTSVYGELKKISEDIINSIKPDNIIFIKVRNYILNQNGSVLPRPIEDFGKATIDMTIPEFLREIRKECPIVLFDIYDNSPDELETLKIDLFKESITDYPIEILPNSKHTIMQLAKKYPSKNCHILFNDNVEDNFTRCMSDKSYLY